MGKNSSPWWGWLPASSLAVGWQWCQSYQSAAPCNVHAKACPRPCREIKGCVALPSVLLTLCPKRVSPLR